MISSASTFGLYFWSAFLTSIFNILEFHWLLRKRSLKEVTDRLEQSILRDWRVCCQTFIIASITLCLSQTTVHNTIWRNRTLSYSMYPYPVHNKVYGTSPRAELCNFSIPFIVSVVIPSKSNRNSQPLVRYLLLDKKLCLLKALPSRNMISSPLTRFQFCHVSHNILVEGRQCWQLEQNSRRLNVFACRL